MKWQLRICLKDAGSRYVYVGFWLLAHSGVVLTVNMLV
jgi:hypothetical protein